MQERRARLHLATFEFEDKHHVFDSLVKENDHTYTYELQNLNITHTTTHDHLYRSNGNTIDL